MSRMLFGAQYAAGNSAILKVYGNKLLPFAFFQVRMPSSTAFESSQTSEDPQIWDSLKQAIATSSGFQRWQIEHSVDEYCQGRDIPLREISLDYRVRRYLRETLETLAY